MVTVVSAATDAVSIVKDAVELLVSTVTAAGSFATSLLLVSNATLADDSIAALNVTTPVGCPCCRIVDGEMLSDCSVADWEPDDDGGVDVEGEGADAAGAEGPVTAEGPSCCPEELPLSTSPHAPNDTTRTNPATQPVALIRGLPFFFA
jgi:hypothetical protein